MKKGRASLAALVLMCAWPNPVANKPKTATGELENEDVQG